MSAARAGEYRRAVAEFRAARATGLDTPALHFNLGVALFRLGHLDAAVAAFRRAADSPELGGPASYNLGRIARDRDDVRTARQWFARAAERARTDAVRERALAALGVLVRPAPPSSGFAFVAVGAGHDSNITLAPPDSATASREGSPFVLTEAYAEHSIGARWSLFGSTFGEYYTEMDGYDLESVTAGARWRAERGRPQIRIAARHTRFGGEPFEHAVLADLRLRRTTARGVLHLGLGVDGLAGARGKAYLDGTRRRMSASWTTPVFGGDWSARYTLSDLARGDGESTAGAGYSYRRNAIALTYERAFAGGYVLAVDGSWAAYRYDDRQRGDEGAIRVGIQLERPLTEAWQVAARAEAERHQARTEAREYRRRRVTARLERTW